MTRSHRRRLVALTAGTALTLPAGLLAGCSAGQLAATSLVVSAVPGGSGDAWVPPPNNANAPDQRISIRNAVVDFAPSGQYPAGADAPITLWIGNGTGQVVTLVGVAALNGIAAGCVPSASVSPTPPPTPTAPASTPGTSASGTSVPGVSATPRPSATPTGSVPPPAAIASAVHAVATTFHLQIQPGQSVTLAQGSSDGCVRITDLAQPIKAGFSVGMIFTFTTAGGGTYTIGTKQDPLQVPFGVPSSPLPRASISLGSPSGE